MMNDRLLAALLRFPRERHLSVLIYHRVLAETDFLRPSEPTAQQFESRMGWLKKMFNVIALADGVLALKTGRLPERAVAITFDDGYRDNWEIATPILLQLGLPATFFVAAGYLDGGRMFNDTVIESIRQAQGDCLDLADLGLETYSIGTEAQRLATASAIIEKLKYRPCRQRAETAEKIAERAKATLPNDLMMSSDQLVSMHRAGMQVGGHTVMHPILNSVDPESARREIADGRARLEHIIDSKVTLFAYPNGRPGRDYTSQHVDLVKQLGFDAAVSTAWGAACSKDDLFQLPRFTPWDAAHWKFAVRIARTSFARNFQTA